MVSQVVHFDIETIPSQMGWVKEYYEEKTEPPKKLKKEESIENWILNEKDQAVEDAISKAGFSGATNHIVCISWCITDDKDNVITSPEYKSSFVTENLEPERLAIQSFFDDIKVLNYPTFAGHNIIGFDLRVIKQRAMVLGVKIPRTFPIDPKPWDKSVYDTMLKWDSSYGNMAKMDLVAKAFGIKGKGDIDGSMVYPMWLEGKHKEIKEYCEDDVRMGRELYCAMNFIK